MRQSLDDGEPSTAEPSTAEPLADVRSELRRLGYLDHQVERYLLQDALRPDSSWHATLTLSAKVGALIGIPAALLGALALAAINGHLEAAPFDILPLFVHLAIPGVLLLGGAFLLLAAAGIGLLRVLNVRRIEALSLGVAMVAASTVLLIAWQVRGALPDVSTSAAVGTLLLLPLLAWAVLKVVHGGLLTLAIRLTERTPERPPATARWLMLALIAGIVLVILPAALEVGRQAPQVATSLPTTGTSRVLVIGIDGILRSEVEFLLSAERLPALAHLADSGATLRYQRDETSPSGFWATIATGLPSPEHGLEAVDSFRPFGLSRALHRSGWLRHYWSALSSVGIAEHRALLSDHRRAWSFWELAARGSGQAVAVNWWGTFPAQADAGYVVSHGAYQLLLDGAEHAVEPASVASHLTSLARQVELPPALTGGMGRALGADQARHLFDTAALPDVFYRQAARRGAVDLGSPRAVALYLPALDIAADLAEQSGTVAFAELASWQLQSVDRLISEFGTDFDTVVVVLDPGRRQAEEGMVLLVHGRQCSGEASIQPAQVASAILRALGLPQSRQLPPPPDACRWQPPALTVDSYGERLRPSEVPEGEEYLRSLESLGYL